MSAQGFRSMTWLIVIELFVMALLWRCYSSTADAQAPNGADQLTLAQAAVGECGWINKRCHAGVWWFLRARAHVRRRTITETTHDYCATWDASNDDNNRARWVRDLPAVEVRDGIGTDAVRGAVVGDGRVRGDVGGDVDGGRLGRGGSRHLVGRGSWDGGDAGDDVRRPRGWPGNASWPRHLRLWRAVYARAGAFLRGRVANPCNRVPVHTGATYGVDLARAQRAQWVALECGDTGRQAFYGRGER